VPLPNLRRQVPEWWRTFFSPPAAASLYGLGLGVGFFTYLSFGTLVAVVCMAAASGSAAVGALVVAPFGVARGLSVLVSRSATTAEGVTEVTRRLDAIALSRVPKRANGVALTAIAAVAVFEAARTHGSSRSSAAAAVLAAVFAWSAVAKLIRPAAWRAAVDGYRLGCLRLPALVAVPIAEAAVVGLAAAGAERTTGWLALALMIAFTAAILRARRLTGDRVACGCFGRTKARDYRVLVVRNAVLAAMAILAAVASSPSPWRLHEPTGREALPAALAVAGIILALALLRPAARILAQTRRP
jgi:hypothetical protein